MSSETLYRKYRSKDFDEVIGQEHITKTLLNSIKKDSFAHAYLLTGPRGVGKTTVARLFAYKINGVKYGSDETYSDIIEIDAASNRRIDEIRELRDKVNIAPSALKYKVYIIDEVHMLTKEAFNALLKTLEEPPEHAVFILATTDFHKVPDTIKSRCIRFAFKSISESSIKKHLSDIAKKETVIIEDGALEIIADNADGSFRDAISLLDQFRNSEEKVKTEYVAEVLGMSPEKEIISLLSLASQSKPREMMVKLDKLREAGASDEQITKQLIDRLRSSLLENEHYISRKDTIKLIEGLLKVENYKNKKIALELALIEACGDTDKKTVTMNTSRPDSDDKNKSEDSKDEAATDKQSEENSAKQESSISSDDDGANLWENVLSELKAKHNTLYAIARMAEPIRTDGSLELHFKFPFHYKQMRLEKNHMQLKKIIKDMDHKITEVELVQKKGSGDDGSEKTEHSVKSISNIFGPSEVLES